MTTIWHTWSEYSWTESDHRRILVARESWFQEWKIKPNRWRSSPLEASGQARDSSEIGDPRPMPYVSDVIDHVLTRNPPNSDVIAFTNADVCFCPGLTGWILDTVPRHGAAYTHRWDFKRLEKPLVNEAQVKRGAWYPGSDAFFFTVGWWKAHRLEYPDMILGREQCDEVLRQLVKRHGGREIPGAIYHEKHESFWQQPGTLGDNPGNRHNRKLARRWFLKTGYRSGDPEWWRI
jgi:hypothetical protein